MYYVFAWCQAFRLGFVGSSSGFKFNNLDFSGWWVLPFLNSGYIYFTAKCCFNLQWFCFGYKIMYVNPGLVWGLQRSCAERKWRWCSQPPTSLTTSARTLEPWNGHETNPSQAVRYLTAHFSDSPFDTTLLCEWKANVRFDWLILQGHRNYIQGPFTRSIPWKIKTVTVPKWKRVLCMFTSKRLELQYRSPNFFQFARAFGEYQRVSLVASSLQQFL
mgnify:FL=1